MDLEFVMRRNDKLGATEYILVDTNGANYSKERRYVKCVVSDQAIWAAHSRIEYFRGTIEQMVWEFNKLGKKVRLVALASNPQPTALILPFNLGLMYWSD